MQDLGLIIYFNLPPIALTFFIVYVAVKYTYERKSND